MAHRALNVPLQSHAKSTGKDDFAIRLDHVTKDYGKTRGLEDCTLTLPQGTFMALVGPNGAGKSTLLNLLVGLLTPTSGSVSICGFDPCKQRANVLRIIGFVAQDRPLYRSLTVRDTLEMGKRLSASWDQLAAADRIRRLEIPLDRQVGSLSGGQQAQVSLTLALGKRPEILILDEPMANLDPVARHEFLAEVVAASAEHTMTVIMSSHVIAELGRVSNHVAVLKNGRLIVSGPVNEILASRLGAHGLADDQFGVTDLEHIVLSYLTDVDVLSPALHNTVEQGRT